MEICDFFRNPLFRRPPRVTNIYIVNGRPYLHDFLVICSHNDAYSKKKVTGLQVQQKSKSHNHMIFVGQFYAAPSGYKHVYSKRKVQFTWFSYKMLIYWWWIFKMSYRSARAAEICCKRSRSRNHIITGPNSLHLPTIEMYMSLVAQRGVQVVRSSLVMILRC